MKKQNLHHPGLEQPTSSFPLQEICQWKYKSLVTPLAKYREGKEFEGTENRQCPRPSMFTIHLIHTFVVYAAPLPMKAKTELQCLGEEETGPEKWGDLPEVLQPITRETGTPAHVLTPKPKRYIQSQVDPKS